MDWKHRFLFQGSLSSICLMMCVIPCDNTWVIFDETHDSKIKIKKWLRVKHSSQTQYEVSVICLLIIKILHYSYPVPLTCKSQSPKSFTEFFFSQPSQKKEPSFIWAKFPIIISHGCFGACSLLGKRKEIWLLSFPGSENFVSFTTACLKMNFRERVG